VRAVDREAPLRFLRTAFQPDDWVAILLKSYETGRVHQRVGPLDWVMHPRFQAWLRFKNSQKYNVYCGVNAIVPWKRTRTRDSIGAVRHVFLEADRDGPAVLARIAARSDLPEPSYVLHSSPNRVHVFWRVTGFEPDYVETLQQQLARELDTDPAATPATQATRLVGYSNHKYQPFHLVTIEYRCVDCVSTPTDFPGVARVIREASTPDTGQPPPTRAPRIAYLKTRGVDPVERARRYLSRVPPAIAGEHGDVQTFRVCCRLARGFALEDDLALAALAEWNSRCRPPWKEEDLRDKLQRARRYGREPIAGLLSSER
jgi:RepB DNA-primase from phage plasmid